MVNVQGKGQKNRHKANKQPDSNQDAPEGHLRRGGCVRGRRTTAAHQVSSWMSPTRNRTSSLREIPTVTVLAWCLMASTGRVNSSMEAVRASSRDRKSVV